MPSTQELPSTQRLIEATLKGDRLALARIITAIERDSPEVAEILRQLFPRAGRAYEVGFTGPPGAGKSTVVDQITAALRAEAGAPTVGIVAVDPTSPFSGGAILGDRIRMQQHYKDEGVFVRSMATRGSHGGLPGLARRVIMAMDAAGRDYVLIETVGVGQTELDIIEVADTVVVILVPEVGDTVQTMKAGLMEIADIFVINKADREGADRIAKEIRGMLHLNAKQDWDIPVLLTQAHKGEGIPELKSAIQDHRRTLETTGALEKKREKRRASEFFRTVEDRIGAGLRQAIARNGELQSSLRRVQRGEVDPYTAAAEALQDPELLRHLFPLRGDRE